MTDQEIRQLMTALNDQKVAFARMEEKVDGLKEDVDALKSTNQWLLRSLGAALIPLVVGALVAVIVATGGKW